MSNGLTSGLKRFQVKASIAGGLIVFFLYYLPVLNGLKDAFSGAAFLNVLDNPVIIHSLRFTVEQATLSVILSILVGTPAGFALIGMRQRASRLIRTILLTVFMAPSMVVVMGFTSLYGENGIISSRIHLLSRLGEGFTGILAAHVFYNAPLIAIMVYNSMASIPKEYWDLITATAGFSSRTVWRKVFLPYMIPGIVSGGLLAFIYCFMSFAIPLNLGGPRFSTLEVNIYMYYKILQNGRIAASIALIQYIILLFLIAVMIKASSASPHAPLAAKAKAKLSKVLMFASASYVGALLLYLIAPLAGSLYYSFYNPITGSYTANYYRHVLSTVYDPRLGIPPINTLLNSLYYAFMTVILSLGIGTLLSIGWGRVNDVIVVSLLAISPITLGLGLLRTIPPWIPVWVSIILAHTFAGLPLALRSIRLGLERVSRKYIEASLSLGETLWGTLFRVAVPISKQSYVTAAAFAAAISLGEFTATLFLRTVRTTTLAVAIYQYRSLRMFGEAYAASGVLLFLTLITIYIIARFEGVNANGSR
ncbi:MAG: iron ABC transporter permease [Desulfurococcales archaeon]|nr:iron ABC transporter permease [Desulfurococcales archaeon]